MQCFGYEDLPKTLNGAGVHSLDNVMTLDPTIHGLFDNLGLWFEGLVSDFSIFCPHKLEVCRRTRRIPMLFVPGEAIILNRARQTQLPSEVHTQASCCRTPSTSRSTLHVVELPIYLGPVSTWTRH
jgi:hypothetical protein